MKKTLLLLLIMGACFLKAQIPYIGTSTIIPQNPTPGSFIKIVTHVTTPNQGGVVHTSLTVTGNTIYVEGCYWQGMATALDDHIDTFMVGQLPAGNYQIHHTAYLSSTMQHCTPTNTNTSNSQMQVTGPPTGTYTAIRENQEHSSFRLYPNLSTNTLFFSTGNSPGELLIYSAGGSLVKKVALARDGEIDISDLANGLYFTRFNDKSRTVSSKFIKMSAE